MRIVWAYRSYVGNTRYSNKVSRDCELLVNEELRVFSAGLATWQILEPACTRVFYGDKSMVQFLREKGLADRFHEIYTVDFEKEIDEKYPDIDFFATPKIWALTQQKEPFFLVDTELMLMKPLKEWIEEGEYVAVRYELQNPIVMKNWNREDMQNYLQLEKDLGEDSKFLRPDKMINAGLTSWPDPEIAKQVGLKALEICQKVCRSELSWRYKWTFCEESILVPLIQYFSGKTVKFLPNMFETHDLGFTEWSNPSVAGGAVYSPFLWWCANHPRIPVEKMLEVDTFAEYTQEMKSI